jgi:hypothetical protein
MSRQVPVCRRGRWSIDFPGLPARGRGRGSADSRRTPCIALLPIVSILVRDLASTMTGPHPSKRRAGRSKFVRHRRALRHRLRWTRAPFMACDRKGQTAPFRDASRKARHCAAEGSDCGELQPPLVTESCIITATGGAPQKSAAIDSQANRERCGESEGRRRRWYARRARGLGSESPVARGRREWWRGGEARLTMV